DRTALGEEILTLRNEIDNIAGRTKFNGLSLLTGALATSQSGGTLVTGLALATTVAATVSNVDVTHLQAGTTFTVNKVDADTISITDGTNTTNADVLDGTIGADGTMTISF